MTTEQLAALKEVAKNAETPGPWRASDLGPCDGWQISGGPKDDCVVSDGGDLWEQDALFIAAFDPTTCLELIEEVERLRNQWNTRFNTLCGNCGNRYRGPRDEHLHGIEKCGSAEEETTYMQMFTDTNVGDD